MRKTTLAAAAAGFITSTLLFGAMWINPQASGKVIEKTIKTGTTLSESMSEGKVSAVKISSFQHKKMLAVTSDSRLHVCSTGSFRIKKGNTTYKFVVKQRRQNGGSVVAYQGESFSAPLGNSWTEPISGNKWVIKSSNSDIATAKVVYDGASGRRILEGQAKALGKAKINLISPCGVKAVYTVTVREKEKETITVTETLPVTVKDVEPEPEMSTTTTANITVKYLYSDGSIARPTEVKQYEVDSPYYIEAPVITGYKPDKDSVMGKATANMTITFTYTQKTGLVVIKDVEPTPEPTPAPTTATPTVEYANQLFMTVGGTGEYNIPQGYMFVTVSGQYGVVTANTTGTSFTGNEFGYVEAVYMDSKGNKIILPIFVS